jgi:hypothetical protein
MKTDFKTTEHTKFDDTTIVHNTRREKIMNIWTQIFFSSSTSINLSHVISQNKNKNYKASHERVGG